MPGGVLMFVPIYHPLHDLYGIHSEVTFFLLFSIFSMIVLHGLLSDREKAKEKLSTIDYVLIVQLAVHYITYWVFVAFFHPEREWSLGLHEPVGPCNEVATLTTAFGKKPQNGASWYVICGTPFANRVEYITVLSTILVVAVGVFYGLYFKTQPQTQTNKKLKKN
ncbi:hypothetical protein O0L34_g19091 [Tuta absoluta]|nr:hypothetical protein O0L34_g19091 [Tuta absoluta]